MEPRGMSGLSWQAARYETISSSLISLRSSSGRTSSNLSPVNCSALMVARSVPDPLTHSTSTSRPAWSFSLALVEVLPPPKFATARSRPRDSPSLPVSLYPSPPKPSFGCLVPYPDDYGWSSSLTVLAPSCLRTFFAFYCCLFQVTALAEGGYGIGRAPEVLSDL